MPEEVASNPANPEVRYEKTDARFGPIAALGIALAVLGIVIHFAVGGLINYFQEEKKEYPLSNLARERPKLPKDIRKIPEPRLQQSETADMTRLRSDEDAILNSYGWVDAKKGIVRIPIEEAMRMLANPKTAKEKGIRVQPGGKNEEAK
jgi:hypothetical protein